MIYRALAAAILVAGSASCSTLSPAPKDASPLFLALAAQDKGKVLQLLKEGADPNAPSESGDSATAWAATMDDPQFLEIILAHGGNPSIVNPNSAWPTPLFTAISRLQSRNVETLIRAGADVNFASLTSQENAAMAAGSLNQWQIVYLLLKAGTDYIAKDRWGYTIAYGIEYNNIVADTELFSWREKVIALLRDKGVTVIPKAPLPRKAQ
jgi:ankyrin repeat protein